MCVCCTMNLRGWIRMHDLNLCTEQLVKHSNIWKLNELSDFVHFFCADGVCASLTRQIISDRHDASSTHPELNGSSRWLLWVRWAESISYCIFMKYMHSHIENCVCWNWMCCCFVPKVVGPSDVPWGMTLRGSKGRWMKTYCAPYVVECLKNQCR